MTLVTKRLNFNLAGDLPEALAVDCVVPSRQRFEREEAAFGNFLSLWALRDLAAHVAADVKEDMVAIGDARMEIDAEELRRRPQRHIALFEQFPLERFQRRLIHLDPAAGKLPAGHVGVADQKEPALVVEGSGAYAECQPPLLRNQRCTR